MIIIVVLMFIGLFASVCMLFPNPRAKNRDELARMKRKETFVIECECAKLLLLFLHKASQLAMGICCLVLFSWVFTDDMPATKWIVVLLVAYVCAAFVNYLIYLRLDRIFYFTKEGLWIDKIEGDPVKYEDIVLVKTRFTLFPFTDSDFKLKISVHGKTYVVSTEGYERGVGLKRRTKRRIETLLSWLPEPRVQKASERVKHMQKHVGISMTIVGACTVVVFGFLLTLCLGPSGNGMTEGMVSESEAGWHSDISDIKREGDGRAYCLLDEAAAVNVYAHDQFVYSYRVPKGAHGAMRQAISGDKVYIINRDDRVFAFEKDQYLGEVDLRALDTAVKNDLLSYKQEEVLYEGIINEGSCLTFVILGILIGFAGGGIYNKGRYRVKEVTDQQ